VCLEKIVRFANGLKGAKNITKNAICKENEKVEITNESGEKNKKASRTTFEMIGIAIGTKIYFHRDEKYFAFTCDNVNQIRDYCGRRASISAIAKKIGKELGFKSQAYNGFKNFYLDTKKDSQPLSSMRTDKQDK